MQDVTLLCLTFFPQNKIFNKNHKATQGVTCDYFSNCTPCLSTYKLPPPPLYPRKLHQHTQSSQIGTGFLNSCILSYF